MQEQKENQSLVPALSTVVGSVVADVALCESSSCAEFVFVNLQTMENYQELESLAGNYVVDSQ